MWRRVPRSLRLHAYGNLPGGAVFPLCQPLALNSAATTFVTLTTILPTAVVFDLELMSLFFNASHKRRSYKCKCFRFPHLECRRMPMPSATASAASSTSARRATSSSGVLARKTDGARTSSPTRMTLRCGNSQPVPSHLLYQIDLESFASRQNRIIRRKLLDVIDDFGQTQNCRNCSAFNGD